MLDELKVSLFFKKGSTIVLFNISNYSLMHDDKKICFYFQFLLQTIYFQLFHAFYRVFSSSLELLIELYCEFRDLSILKKLPIAKIVLRWRWKIPWYRASRKAFLSSATSTCEVTDDWCDNTRARHLKIIYEYKRLIKKNLICKVKYTWFWRRGRFAW